MKTPSVMKFCVLLLLAALIAGCANMGDRRQPIPTQMMPAPSGALATIKPLVVVLPGRRDNVEVMARYGIAEAIQRSWPDADVMLTSATMDYYLEGNLAQRLHAQIVLPARARGVREIWLVGASLGGMGALLYERQYPGEVQGLVLLAPYLGESGLLREITQAGGIGAWQPDTPPQPMSPGTHQIELWRFLQTWKDDLHRGERVWIAYGDQDRLRDAIPVIAPLVPCTQILKRPGGHKWSVWTPAAEEVFRLIALRP